MQMDNAKKLYNSIFGDTSWERLPDEMKRHWVVVYDNAVRIYEENKLKTDVFG